MANVFNITRGYNEKTPRNNFDLSFQNHLTMKFGKLYPVFCKEVVPGDSFRIDSAFGLKFMPLVFPVQSQMRAHMHFFYCRNKNLWKNWENWLMNLKEHTHPYISQPSSFFKTGSLADYLDIPTTLISSVPQSVGLTIPSASSSYQFSNTDSSSAASRFLTPVWADRFATANPIVNMSSLLGYNSSTHSHNLLFPCRIPLSAPFAATPTTPKFRLYTNNGAGDSLLSRSTIGVVFSYSDSEEFEDSFLLFTLPGTLNPTDSVGIFDVIFENTDFTDERKEMVNRIITSGKKVYVSLFVSSDITTYPYFPLLLNPNVYVYDKIDTQPILFTGLYYDADVTLPVDLSTISGSNPFSTENDEIRLNALPFRAYESIYRAFYANSVLQPLVINGETEYNKYVTTDDDGADTTDYHLFERNYESDFLTSAFPSPQQGPAPVIGMSALGDITLEDESGITTAHAEVGEDGDTITGVTITSPVASQGHRVALAELASAGFTISSFRNGNALTRWLEMNMRKGYRYLDFIQGHHNVRPEYRELDMPEFIGGYSRDVQVNSILNQTASPDPTADPLGAFAGTANCFGGSNHSINHFCDDYGWIIGILCVTPSPAYSQLLPKQFLKYNPLDYYFHEFSQLGLQPITYEEVCPVQAFAQSVSDSGDTSVRDTFGYQRPNYDLVAYTDQVHGDFRTNLRNFLINRLFGLRPELGNDFLTIKPEEVNDIFAVTTPDNDVIAGQIVFRVHAKRPIPRVSIPSLGR